jgi:nucleolar pre-ribosomal-associated protein 1
LLKLVVTSQEGELYNGIKTVLVAILRDTEMLQMDTQPDALDALIASLGSSCGASSTPPQVLEFLDDCCARFTKGPIKYFDDLDTLREEAKGATAGPFSPLLMTLVEQWPFKAGKPEPNNPAEPIAHFLSKFLYLLKLIGEDETLLALVRDRLVSSADSAYQQVLKDSFLWKMGKEKAKEALKQATGADFSGSERSVSASLPPEPPQDSAVVAPRAELELPPQEDEKHAGLNKWRKKDLEESIDDGDIGELLLCLCSRHAEIRLQAVANIRQLMAKIGVRSSKYLSTRLLTSIRKPAIPICCSSGFYSARLSTQLVPS